MEKKGAIISPDTICFQRRLPGSLEEVWAYLTESGKRSQWLAAGEMELAPGAETRLHFIHSELSPLPGKPPEKYKEMNGGFEFPVKILRVEPLRLLSITWAGGSEVTFGLEQSGEYVLLTVTHIKLPADDESMASVLAGWHTHLDFLADRLNGGTPPNFWSLHTQLEQSYGSWLASKEKLSL